MTTAPAALTLRALRAATRDAMAAGVTPVEALDAVGAEIFRRQSLEELGLTHPAWDGQRRPRHAGDCERDCHASECDCGGQLTEDEKRAELRARLARHDREALSPGGRPRRMVS